MKKFSLLVLVSIFTIGCSKNPTSTSTPSSASGIKKATVAVETGSDGLTLEQRNIADRLKMENMPGSVKHLYLISAYSGQCILYSTVKGKVTSSGKRLTPKTVASGAYDGPNGWRKTYGVEVDISGKRYITGEVLQDDGTYGNSIEYLYWFDSKGVYHQHYISGGQIVHVSNQPLRVKNIVINVEEVDTK